MYICVSYNLCSIKAKQCNEKHFYTKLIENSLKIHICYCVYQNVQMFYVNFFYRPRLKNKTMSTMEAYDRGC